MTEQVVYSQIVKLIAYHKAELLTNIKRLGYALPNDKDETLVAWITYNAAKPNVAQMLGEMIFKYQGKVPTNGEIYSNVLVVDDIVKGVGDIVGGVTGVFKAKEENKGIATKAQADMMTQLLALQAQKEQLAAAPKGLSIISTGKILAIAGAVTLIVITVLVLTLKKPKVQQIQYVQPNPIKA